MPQIRMSPRAVFVRWASRQLSLQRGGRLIGVRYGGTRMDVAYVAPGADEFVWVDPEGVARTDEMIRWMQTSHFSAR